MRSKTRRRIMAALAGTMIVGGPVLAACSSGPSFESWAATDGAAGRINLDAVQEAFKDSDSVTEFERRVNEIFEGDGIVLGLRIGRGVHRYSGRLLQLHDLHV